MSPNERPCPIWSYDPSEGYSEQQVHEFKKWGRLCDYPRAGGRFVLKQSGAALLRSLTDRQKANLSYWIYDHNLRYRLFDEAPDREGKPPALDQAWVESHRNLTPSVEDRVSNFLREVIRSDDAGEEPHEELQLAAGGCRHDGDLKELRLYAIDRGWLRGGGTPGSPSFPYPGLIELDLGARIHVEERTRELDQERQGFVAMWFDPSMDEVYECGIKPAIKAAGYKPHKIDQEAFLGSVVDRIVAEIRKSRFVVADFTTSPEAGDRGGVYYEAGFAHGLGIPVIHTCHKDSMKALHFDTNHLNHLIWTTPEELKHRLKYWIEATIEPGPLGPSNRDQADVGSNGRVAS